MCLFLSYPIFLIGNWPFFLSFPFCSSFSLLLRVGVCVCQLHSAPVVHVSLKTKQKRFHLFYFFLFSLAILFEFKSISTRKLFPGLLLRPTQPVHPSPPESCNGAAALNCSRRVRLFAPIQSALSQSFSFLFVYGVYMKIATTYHTHFPRRYNTQLENKKPQISGAVGSLITIFVLFLFFKLLVVLFYYFIQKMTSGSSQGVVHLTTVHSLGAIKFRRLPITPHSLRLLDIYFTLILCASLFSGHLLLL